MFSTSLFFTYIKRSFESRPAVHGLLIVMQIVSLLCIFLVFGLIYRAFTVFEAASDREKELGVNFENLNGETKEEMLSTCLDSDTFVSATEEFLAFLSDECNNPATYYVTHGIAEYNGMEIRFVAGGGSYSADNGIPNSATVSSNSLAFGECKIGDKLIIGGKEVTVANVIEGQDKTDILLGSIDIIPSGGIVRDLVIQLERKPTYTEAENIENLINKLYIMPSSLHMPEGLDLLDEQLNTTQIAVSVVMIFFAVFNCSFCYYYKYINNKNTLRVFRLCGATSSDCRRIYIMEVLLHSMAIILIALVLYERLFKALAIRYFSGIEGCYTFNNYCFVILAYLVISILILLICMSRFTSMPLVQKDFGEQ